MRVFITGGTGTIAQAIIKELRRGGHEGTGFSRSEGSDTKLKAIGATRATVMRGIFSSTRIFTARVNRPRSA